ncbi:MAG: DUF1127 domain-containing protein [Tabrizicola flagellatus]|jgi:uncharacterized protein YjiS (DUF1127 family)|uniref:DUF1127 domain-containing protein n=1 Tax=Tabrizicola flagellatus TaxID=2593021 RepID=UPI003918E030
MSNLHRPNLPLSRPTTGLAVGSVTLIDRFHARDDRQRQRAGLAGLDDAGLADLGLSRAEALAEARRHD